MYLLVTSAAYASDSCPDPGQPGPVANPKVPPANNGAAKPSPTFRPDFKPISPTVRGTFVGATSAIYGAASESGDFLIGVACAECERWSRN